MRWCDRDQLYLINLSREIIQLSNTTNQPINEIMKNEKIYDIHERIYQWVIRVIKFTQKLSRTSQNSILVEQITKSVTSVGANDQEADASNSKRDFIAKYVIARKECKETVYWLRVIKDTNLDSFKEEAEELISEGKEISYIISTIVKNANN